MEPVLSPNARKLLDFIRSVAPTGTHLGNIKLRRLLDASGIQLSLDQYWEAQNELFEEGFIGIGRGKGGGLWLREPTERAAEISGLVEREDELYQPLVKWIDENWGGLPRRRRDFFLVKITATGFGRRRDTGPWSRPDVSLVRVNKFGYLYLPQVEVSSFEVKQFEDGDDLNSVYEAAAHSRWVHNSWLVVEDSADAPREFDERFLGELERFGVGLMRMSQEKGQYGLEEELSPRYQIPEPEQLNEFLEYFFAGDEPNLRDYKDRCRIGF